MSLFLTEFRVRTFTGEPPPPPLPPPSVSRSTSFWGRGIGGDLQRCRSCFSQHRRLTLTLRLMRWYLHYVSSCPFLVLLLTHRRCRSLVSRMSSVVTRRRNWTLFSFEVWSPSIPTKPHRYIPHTLPKSHLIRYVWSTLIPITIELTRASHTCYSVCVCVCDVCVNGCMCVFVCVCVCEYECMYVCMWEIVCVSMHMCVCV